MQNVIQNINEITDSREMLEAKPHKFVSIFTYILIVIVTTALGWSYIGKIDIVIKSSGVVRPNDKVTTVLNEIDGKVSEVKFKEGQKVKKGDILYTLECKDYILSKINLNKQLSVLQKDIENMDKLRKSIIDNKNYFDKNSEEQREYYNKYQKYDVDNKKIFLAAKQNQLQADIADTNKIITAKTITEQISKNNDVINNLKLLLNSIKENKNLFNDGNSIYSNQYLSYQLSIEQLKNNIEQKTINLDISKNKLNQALLDYEREISSTEDSYNKAVLELNKYKSQYLSQISNQIEQNNSALLDLKLSSPTTSKQISQYQSTINNLQLILNSIKQGKSLFTSTENSYYNQYIDYNNNIQKYQLEISQAVQFLDDLNKRKSKGEVIEDITIKNAQSSVNSAVLALQSYQNSFTMNINQNIENAQNMLEQLIATASASAVDSKYADINNTILNLKTLQNSVINNISLFNDSNKEYYDKFFEYQNNISQLQNNITQQAKLISNLESKKALSIDDFNYQLKDIQRDLAGTQIDLSKFQNQSFIDIKNKIEDATKYIDKLQADLEQTKLVPQINEINKEIWQNDITKYKMDMLVQLDDSIKLNKQKIDELNNSLGNIQLNLDKSIIKAPIDGVVNIKNDINIGQLIRGGVEILSIIPQDSSKYKVQIYVSNKDIAGIKVGEKVKYQFSALPYQEYGELTGVVTNVSTDATIDPQTGSNFYIVESEIKNSPLYSYKGNKGEIKVGMTCEAQVITNSKRILNYVMEKLHFKVTGNQ